MDLSKKVSHWIDVLKYLFQKSQKDQITIHSASLTYTTILSLIPVLAIFYVTLDLVGSLDRMELKVSTFISENLAPNFAEQIMTYIQTLRRSISPGTLGIFGILGFIASCIFMLIKIEYSFNIIWQNKKVRPWLRKLTTYWTMSTLGPIALGLSILFSENIYAKLTSQSKTITGLFHMAFIWVPWLAVSLLISFAYYLLPACRIRYRYALIAGLITGGLFEGAKGLFSLYSHWALKSSIYGSLAAIPVLLLWLNLVWILVLFGAQICYFIDEKPKIGSAG